MDVGPAFVAHHQAAEAVEPSQGPLDHPAEDSQAAAVVRSASAEDGDDAAAAEPVAMRLRIVAAVALEGIRPMTGPTPAPRKGRQRPHELFELCNVVDVRGADLRASSAGVRTVGTFLR